MAVNGESITPLKTGWFTKGPGGSPAATGGAPSASQTFDSLPKGGSKMLVVIVEAPKSPKTSWVIGLMKAGPGFVFGSVEVGGRISSGSVTPDVKADQAVSLVRHA